MFGLVPFKKGMQPGKKAGENVEKPPKRKIQQEKDPAEPLTKLKPKTYTRKFVWGWIVEAR